MGTVCANELRKDRLGRPATFGTPGLVAMAIILSVVEMTAAFGQPASPQPFASQQPEWERLFAASPQRELRREWDSCVGNVAELIIAQGGTLDQVQQLAFGGCADEQSRLTGAMVREFGYERGDRAVRNARAARLDAYRQRLAARTSAQTSQNVVARTRSGWDIIRLGPNSCGARLLYRSPFEQSFAYLRRDLDGDALILGRWGLSQQAMQRNPGGVRVSIPLTRYVNYGGAPIGSVEFVTMSQDDTFGYVATLSPDLWIMIGNADAIQFGGAYAGYTFHVTGIADAWTALLQCASN